MNAQKGMPRPISTALMLVFTALAIFLHLFKYPYPLASFLTYDLSEVPLAVLILLDLKLGLAAQPIFWLGLVLLTDDRTKVVGPTMKLLAELSTVIPLLFTVKRFKTENALALRHVAVATALAIICRVAVMTLMNYLVVPYWALWAGWVKNVEDGYRLALVVLPHIALFNATVALYVVPLTLVSWRIAKKLVM